MTTPTRAPWYPDRGPADVAETLRTWGVTGDLEAASMLVSEVDPANLKSTAVLDPLDPLGGPLKAEALTRSLASALRCAGMPLGGEGAAAEAEDARRPVRLAD